MERLRHDPELTFLFREEVGHDALGYALSRVRPAKEMVVLRAALGESQPWAADRQWSQRSQTGRIMTWLTSRPTRPATMHAVNAVLHARHE